MAPPESQKIELYNKRHVAKLAKSHDGNSSASTKQLDSSKDRTVVQKGTSNDDEDAELQAGGLKSARIKKRKLAIKPTKTSVQAPRTFVAKFVRDPETLLASLVREAGVLQGPRPEKGDCVMIYLGDNLYEGPYKVNCLRRWYARGLISSKEQIVFGRHRVKEVKLDRFASGHQRGHMHIKQEEL
ncbi:hypothetical protein HDU76_007014 [Blyttiomyces sp. JEL0837]|nr:hypothetical protein HDU76_007014 [Blyttiomyces sp. JEL0837]